MRQRSLAALFVLLNISMTICSAADKAKPKKKRLDGEFRALFRTFGRNSTTKVKIVSGPEEVKMRNGKVPGKRWYATCGKFRFKLTLQDGVKDTLEDLVKRIERLPMPYVRACQVVSDPTEDGVAIYQKLGGAGAHGGKSYLNTVPRFGSLGIAHESGHVLEQRAREADPMVLDDWKDAAAADKISVSGYGDHVNHEDLAEFAKIHATCLDAGERQLGKLKRLSPARFALWEKILYAEPPGWTQWRGINRDGKSSDRGLLKSWPEGGPKQIWKVTGIGQGFSNVSIGGGLIYTTGRKEVGNPSRIPPAKNVYERPGKRLYIFAIDMDGKYKWVRDLTESYMHYYKGARATPTYDNGHLYLVTGTGLIGCYDARTGETKWQRKMEEFKAKKIKWGFTESVLIRGDLMIISPGGDSFMAALNKTTGKTVWESEEYGPAQYGSPMLVYFNKVPMIINGSHQGLMAVHAKTGRTLWKQGFGTKALACVPTVAYANGHVFWAIGYGKGAICMKMTAAGESVRAKEAWRSDNMDCMVGGYVIHGGHIYGNHKDGMTCLALKNGEKKWFAEGVGKGSVCWADNMLYLYSERDGTAALATCSPKGLELKGTFSVKGKDQSWAHPVVFGGRLYLRYDDNLYCHDVRAK